MKEINQKAPVKCSKKIIINAHSVDVWKALTEIDKWANWHSDIKRSTLNGDLRPGSTFEWKSGGFKIQSTLHTVEPYTQFGWEGKSLGLFAIHNWTITELNKQTEVHVEESMEGILAAVLKILLKKSLNKSLEKWLQFLKKECEQMQNEVNPNNVF